MNMLKHAITEIREVKEIGNGYVNVVLDTDCWGRKETTKRRFKEKDWEGIKAKGYFMA